MLPGSVERGRQVSLRSAESVMTSSGAVTSDGEREKQRRRGRRKAHKAQHNRKGSDSRIRERKPEKKKEE